MEEIYTFYLYKDSKAVVVNKGTIEDHLKQLNEGLALKTQSQPRGLLSKDKKDIFSCRAKIHFKLKKYKEALEDYFEFYNECDRIYDWTVFDTPKSKKINIFPELKDGIQDNAAFMDNMRYFQLLPEFYQCLEMFHLYEESIPYLLIALKCRANLLMHLDREKNSPDNIIMTKTQNLIAPLLGKMYYKSNDYGGSFLAITDSYRCCSKDDTDIARAEWLGDETFHYVQKYKSYYEGLSIIKKAIIGSRRVERGLATLIEPTQMLCRAKAIFEKSLEEATDDDSIDDLHKIVLQYYHLATCHYQLGDYEKAMEMIKKCIRKSEEATSHKDFNNSSFNEFVTEMFITLIVMETKSHHNNIPKKHLETILKSMHYDKMLKAFPNLDHPSYLPQFVNRISFFYSKDREVKRKWRLFKNSALICGKIRDAFEFEIDNYL